MVLDKENVLVCILLIATVRPSLKDLRAKRTKSFNMCLKLLNAGTTNTQSRYDCLQWDWSANGVLTRFQYRWTGFCGSLVGRCRSWVPLHSWCYCHCCPLAGRSWCCPLPWELPDLWRNQDGKRPNLLPLCRHGFPAGQQIWDQFCINILIFLYHATLFNGSKVDDPALVPQQLLLLVPQPLHHTDDWILALAFANGVC